LRHEDDEALLRAYISAWSKFFEQTNYLPHPFSSMNMKKSESKANQASSASSNGKSTTSSLSSSASVCVGSFGQSQLRKSSENHVRKLMLDTWSNSIFNEINIRLQNSAMKIVYAERLNEPFDSQLVIGVRESYGRFLIYRN
jgi:cullin-5